MKIRTYELFFYFKQGEDFAHLLGQTRTVSEALKMWAEGMQQNVNDAIRMAELFDGKDIECDADTHVVSFSGDESVLDEAVKQELLSCDEWDDGEPEEVYED